MALLWALSKYKWLFNIKASNLVAFDDKSDDRHRKNKHLLAWISVLNYAKLWFRLLWIYGICPFILHDPLCGVMVQACGVQRTTEVWFLLRTHTSQYSPKHRGQYRLLYCGARYLLVTEWAGFTLTSLKDGDCKRWLHLDSLMLLRTHRLTSGLVISSFITGTDSLRAGAN